MGRKKQKNSFGTLNLLRMQSNYVLGMSQPQRYALRADSKTLAALKLFSQSAGEGARRFRANIVKPPEAS